METTSAVREHRPTGFTAAGYQAGARFAGLDDFHLFLSTYSRDAQGRLAEACLRRPAVCPRCARADCRRVSTRRMRCRACSQTFDLFDGRWFSKRRIPAKAWLAAIKSFELGLGGRQTARLTGLSMPTVYATLETIRLALCALDSEWRAPAGDEKAPVFGVRRAGDGVKIERIEGPIADAPAVVHQDGFVYTAPAQGYDALIRHPSGAPRATRRRGPRDPFLRYMIARTAKHFGIPEASFPLYLKEYEFRFNRRGRPLF